MSETNGQPIRLDVRTLKIRELRDIETAVGHKITQEMATFDLGMDTIQALMWIALRRIKPDATFEEAGELDFDQILSGLEGPEEMPPNPTPPFEQLGSSEPPSGGTDSTPRPPNGEPEHSSVTSTA